MTWEQLAEKIAQMTPAERQGKVKFVEGYDNFKIWECGVHKMTEDGITDEDGDRIEGGEWYLE